jgi:hypothetical protein
MRKLVVCVWSGASEARRMACGSDTDIVITDIVITEIVIGMACGSAAEPAAARSVQGRSLPNLGI